MQRANAYLELIRERGKKGLPLERVYRQLFNKDLFLMAYGKIYRNQGAMTHGVTEETPDGMSLEKINTIIEILRYERFGLLRETSPNALTNSTTNYSSKRWARKFMMGGLSISCGSSLMRDTWKIGHSTRR